MTEIDPRITKARTALVMEHPFWGALALYLKPVEDPTCDTMWTDGERLGYNLQFLDTLTELQLKGVIAHEVSHCAYRHHTRRGDRDGQLWNEACDYAINPDLFQANFELPADVLNDARFYGMSAEEIYAVLERENPPEGRKSGKGSNGCGEVRDAAKPGEPAKAKQADEDWEVRVRQAVAAELARGAGLVPGNLKRLFDTLRTSTVDWREVLRRFIDEKNRVDYSWQRPNRRLIGSGYILPGQVADGINHIGVMIDSSGSIDEKALSRFMAELQAALDDGSVEKVTVLSCDTRVHNHAEFNHGDQLSFVPEGGGGTRFSPAFEWFEKNNEDTAALIYFTDLDCSDFGKEPQFPVLWLAYGQANTIRERMKRVPWGETVLLAA